MAQRLYFVAIIPDESICSEVTHFKEYAASHFASSHALKSPPHITVIPPFQLSDQRLPDLEKTIKSKLGDFIPFSIQLQGFGSFAPRVVYIQVVLNPALRNIHKALKKTFEQSQGFQPDRRDTYHPHMTIAFRDLSPANYNKAWDYFDKLEYDRTFYVEHVHLLIHENKRWKIHTTWELSRVLK